MKRIFDQILLFTDPQINFGERISNWFSLISKLAPIAFLLDLLNWWFRENEQFGVFVCVALVLNMIFGLAAHIKKKTFKFPDFLGKNAIMMFSMVGVYIALDMLRYTAGDNIAGELFRILIQITTLLYPLSKVMKNSYILTNGKHPPEWIMTRFFNFQKNGDLNEFFKTKNDENN